MKPKSPDSDDIERAVYDGMQDLRTPRPVGRRRPASSKRKPRTTHRKRK